LFHLRKNCTYHEGVDVPKTSGSRTKKASMGALHLDAFIRINVPSQALNKNSARTGEGKGLFRLPSWRASSRTSSIAWVLLRNIWRTFRRMTSLESDISRSEERRVGKECISRVKRDR